MTRIIAALLGLLLVSAVFVSTNFASIGSPTGNTGTVAPLSILPSAGSDCASTTVITIPYGDCYQLYVPIEEAAKISHLCFNVFRADTQAGDVSDIGLAGPCTSGQSNCPLVADIGPTAMATTASQCLAITQGTVTLKPGVYSMLECNAANNVGVTSAQFVSCPTGNRFSLWASATNGVGVDESAAGQINSTIHVPTWTPSLAGTGTLGLIGGY